MIDLEAAAPRHVFMEGKDIYGDGANDDSDDMEAVRMLTNNGRRLVGRLTRPAIVLIALLTTYVMAVGAIVILAVLLATPFMIILVAVDDPIETIALFAICAAMAPLLAATLTCIRRVFGA